MTAQEFINLTIVEEYRPFAKVIVSNAKRLGQHYALKPNDVLPPDDNDNTIFLRVEDLA